MADFGNRERTGARSGRPDAGHVLGRVLVGGSFVRTWPAECLPAQRRRALGRRLAGTFGQGALPVFNTGSLDEDIVVSPAGPH